MLYVIILTFSIRIQGVLFMSYLYNDIFSDFPEIISVKDLTAMLNISKTTAYSLISHKKISTVKIGKDFKIIKQSVIRLILQGDQAL